MEEAIAAYLAPDSTPEGRAEAVRRLEALQPAFAQVVAALRAPLTDAAGDARRAAAVALLADLTLEASAASSSTPTPRPSAAEAHHLARFFAARLSDWPCASPALKGCAALLRHDARWRGRQQQSQPLLSLGDAAALARELAAHAQVQAMVAAERKLAYESWAHLIRGWGRSLASAPPPPEDDEDDGDEELDPPPEVDLVDAVIAAMDGERDPNCLLLALDCVLLLCQVYSEWGGSGGGAMAAAAGTAADAPQPQPTPLPQTMREHLDAGADELFDVAVNSYFPVVLNAGKKKKKKQPKQQQEKEKERQQRDPLLAAVAGGGEDEDDAENENDDDDDDPDARLQRALSRRVVGVMSALPRFAAPSVALIVEKLGSDLPAAKEAAAHALPFLLRGRRQVERAAAAAAAAAAAGAATTPAADTTTTTNAYTPPPPPPLPPLTAKSIVQLAEHAVPVWLALKQELLAPAAAAAAADVAASSGKGGGRAPAALERRAFALRCALSLRDCCSGPVGNRLIHAILSDVCVGDLMRYVGADERAVAAAASASASGSGAGAGLTGAIVSSVPTSAIDRFAQQRLACVATVVGAIAAAGTESARDALEAIGRPTVACLQAAAAASVAAAGEDKESTAQNFAPTRASSALCALSAMLAGVGKGGGSAAAEDNERLAPMAKAAADAARALLQWSGGGNGGGRGDAQSSKQRRELRAWCCSALRAALVGGAPLLPAAAAEEAVRALAAVALATAASGGNNEGDADSDDLRPLELDLDCWAPASESAPAARAAAYLAATVAECASLGQASEASASASASAAAVLAAARDALASALDRAAQDGAQDEARLQSGALAFAVLARVAAAGSIPNAAPARFATACLLPLALPAPSQPLWPPAAACLVREVLPRLSTEGLGPELEQELCTRLVRALAAPSSLSSASDARAALAVVAAALSRCADERQAEAARPAIALVLGARPGESSTALAAGVVGCASVDALRLALGGGGGGGGGADVGALLSSLASFAISTTPTTTASSAAAAADIESAAVARGAAAFALGSLANKWPRLLRGGGEDEPSALRPLLSERVAAALDAAVGDACRTPGDPAATARVLAAAQAVGWAKRGLAMRRERLPVVVGVGASDDDDNTWLLGLLRQIDDASATASSHLGACREAVAAVFGLALCADARAAGVAGLALDARSAAASERPLWQQRALTAALGALERQQQTQQQAGGPEGEGAVLALAQLIRAAPEPALRAAADGVAPRLPAVLRRLSSGAASTAPPSPARVALLRGCLDVMAAALMDPAQRPYLEPRAEDALAALVELSRLRRQGQEEDELQASHADPSASLRETALDCLVAAMEGLPYALLHAQRPAVLRAAADALDDDSRAVRGAAARCRRVWAAGA